MPYDDLALELIPFGKFAFRFTPEVVQALIPNDVAGVYLLLNQSEAVYVGRSDRCLRTRLAYHPYLGCASHFTYEICQSSQRAFYLESYWFHQLQEFAPKRLLNCIHPGKPVAYTQACPFCNPKDIQALQVVFSNFGIFGEKSPSSKSLSV